MTAARGTRLCLFGAAPSTANLGVSALSEATVSGIAERIPDLDLTLFDYRRASRRSAESEGESSLPYRLATVNYSRRYYRPDSLWHIRVAGWLRAPNPVLRLIRDASAVLDLSAGDSFSDLPGSPHDRGGKKRFWSCTLPKLIVLEQKRPLILLPQTYGPFRGARSRAVAQQVLRGCASAWARDPQSFEVLRELLGADFDPDRHRSGVDLAFGLRPRAFEDKLPEALREWLEDRRTPIVGINVSGLVFHNSALASTEYGLRADYRAVIEGLARKLMAETDCRLLLVPHVLAPSGHYESDPDACAEVARGLAPEYSGRVACVPPVLDHAEVKGLIARMDWFCGTRMHSTIAALSSGVPCAAIAYSLKFQGVFETCAQGARVADPRKLDTEETVEHLWHSCSERAAAAFCWDARPKASTSSRVMPRFLAMRSAAEN